MLTQFPTLGVQSLLLGLDAVGLQTFLDLRLQLEVLMATRHVGHLYPSSPSSCRSVYKRNVNVLPSNLKLLSGRVYSVNCTHAAITM